MANLGKEINEQLKKDDKRVVTMDVVVDVLEGRKPFSFVTGIVLSLIC